MKKTLGLLSTVSICLLFAAGAQAGDPAGSWKWKITTPNGDTIETSLKLELKDGSLTGTYANQFGESRNWPQGSALTMILLACVVVALLVYIRQLPKAERHG